MCGTALSMPRLRARLNQSMKNISKRDRKNQNNSALHKMKMRVQTQKYVTHQQILKWICDSSTHWNDNYTKSIKNITNEFFMSLYSKVMVNMDKNGMTKISNDIQKMKKNHGKIDVEQEKEKLHKRIWKKFLLKYTIHSKNETSLKITLQFDDQHK